MNEQQAVAVIGMAARLPGAADLAEFWANLRAGRESITRGTPPVVSDDVGGRQWVYARGVLDDVRRFDAEFFGIPRREAEVLDPQHRCLLELAWNAMEDAGYDPHRLAGRVAVYTTAGANTYWEGRDFGARSAAERLLVRLSNTPDTLSTRISYKLGLTGESVTVQTACSSALVAVHLASEALRHGRADVAVAGGVNIRCYDSVAYEQQDGFILSADGHTRSYDHRASGYVEGDGAGVVVLRRLPDALERGDHIHAVIRGGAMNNDGSAKVGFSAPGVEGQARVISAALTDAGVPAESIGMVEGHGTGTPVGDPIEVRALTRAFRDHTDQTGFCALGSVKANIGHLNYAAGIAGLLKAILCVKHGEIPPAPCFEEPNPDIEFAGSPFYVNLEPRPWPDGPRRAGVSSFGMGGTNVHVIVEQAPEPPPAPAARGEHAILLSARTDEALRAVRERLHAFLIAHPDVDLADLAFTLATGRRQLPRRFAAVVSSTEELARALLEPPEDGTTELAGLARDWASGAEVDWGARYPGRRRVSLPTYPWQGEELWIPMARAESEPEETGQREPREQAPVTEWLYRPGWTRTALPRPYHRGDLAPAGGSCLVFGGHDRLTEAVRAELDAAGLAPVLVEPGAGFEVTAADRVRVAPGEPAGLADLVGWAGPIGRVVYLWPDGGDRDRGIRLGVLTMVSLVQALAAAGQGPELWVLTRGALPTPGAERDLNLEAAALLGLCRVIPQEHPDLRVYGVDVAAGAAPAEVVPRLLAEMASPPDEAEIGYRGADRYVRALERVEAAAHGQLLPLRPGGVYLVVGGSGRIGGAIAEHLAGAGARVALVSRGSDPRVEPPGGEMLVLRADVANEPEMSRAVEEINRRWGPINGVVHAAGVEESKSFAFITDTSTERAEEVLRAKVPGIAVLDRVTRAQPLDFCLVCSSLNAVLGGIAFGVYAAANRYLDGYTRRRRAGGAPWVSVNWDTWRFGEPGTGRIGAAAYRTAIRPEQGVGVLGAIVASGQPQVIVSTVPLAERMERIARSLAVRREADTGGSEVAVTSPEDMTEMITKIIGELVGIDDLCGDDEFLAVGCDSLTLLEAVSRWERRLRTKVPISRLWGCRTIAELADAGWHVVQEDRAAERDAGAQALRYLAG
jgi:acyl transferase domain-containing protein/acyl carrier protein